jgi:hypothetical protein
MNAAMTLYSGPSILSDAAGERTWQHLHCWYEDEGMRIMVRVIDPSGVAWDVWGKEVRRGG